MKNFKILANTRYSNPYDYTTDPQPLRKPFNVIIQISKFPFNPEIIQKIHIYESQEFMDNKKLSATTIQRTFYFSNPIVLTKLKMDEIIGDGKIVMKVEFLGIDKNRKDSFQNPFSGGNLNISKFNYEMLIKFQKKYFKGHVWNDTSDILVSNKAIVDSLGKISYQSFKV